MAFIKTGRLGLRLADGAGETNGHAVISQVADESPAAVAGVRAGDLLLSINGAALGRGRAEAVSHFASAPDGEMMLSLARPREADNAALAGSTRAPARAPAQAQAQPPASTPARAHVSIVQPPPEQDEAEVVEVTGGAASASLS